MTVELGAYIRPRSAELDREVERVYETILMVEQNAAKALEISDYAYVLELGRNRYEGPGAEIRHDERVQRLYLGG